MGLAGGCMGWGGCMGCCHAAQAQDPLLLHQRCPRLSLALAFFPLPLPVPRFPFTFYSFCLHTYMHSCDVPPLAACACPPALLVPKPLPVASWGRQGDNNSAHSERSNNGQWECWGGCLQSWGGREHLGGPSVSLETPRTMSTCVCICVRASTCMHICMDMCVHACAPACTCVQICGHACVQLQAHACTSACTHVLMHGTRGLWPACNAGGVAKAARGGGLHAPGCARPGVAACWHPGGAGGHLGAVPPQHSLP